ncbi:tetratricopeptide repeat protein [Oscillatoria sp. FACHB-1407]|uniref:protein kinase family protein n=1 Tax=Oscillatoria sp. FACHB-1407 TaxID=2692847 RepID=UPI001686407A|nr:protein kinase family protein [Oscillatoria sp. FACHB-1407]MBD2464790.1 tetratricopeptide repeat protein [Oscillatoria sp. FACHB-1407]
MNQLLGGRYQFIKILGSDVLGRTYLVGDTQLSGYPKCVIRHLKLPEQNPRTLRFVLTLLKKKAESLQKFSKHDRIPKILTFFEENNNFYLVEEFIPGQPLTQELAPGHTWTELQATKLLQEMLEILVVVHGWGVVHRNIKPSSWIRRSSDGLLVLAGFGIFREISAQATRSLTSTSGNSTPTTNSIDGASPYTPPDQIQGQLQFNSDLYAVGVIIIQGLTGLTTEVLSQVLAANPANEQGRSWHSHTQTGRELSLVLDKLVHPDSKQRYQQATEALDDLRSQVLSKQNLSKLPTPLSNGGSPNGMLAKEPEPPQPQSPQSLQLPPPPAQASHHRPRRPSLQAIALGAVVVAVLAAVLLKLPQSLLAQYFLQRASEQKQLNRPEEAIASYTRSLQWHPTSSAYFNRGIALTEQQDLQAALEDLDRAIQLDPDMAQAYYERGNLWFELGDRQRAIADYTQTIRLAPNSPKAYVNRGTVRAESGDEQGAIEDYTQAIQLDPIFPAAYLNRCLSRSNLKNHQEAIADCTQAINLQPNSVRAYQNRGLTRRRLGDLTGAIEDFNIAIRLDPQDPDPYYNRGLARYELGDQQGAIADYTAAIQRNPEHVFAHYDRALVRVEAGDQRGAIEDFQQSATLCLNSGRMGCYEDAQYQLKQLQGN